MGIAGEISTGPAEPWSVSKALKGPDGDRWKESMVEDLDGLWEKGRFNEGTAPQGTATIRTRSVFMMKRAAHGSIERYKSRPVAREYTQRSGVDFFETFSSVVGFETMRTVLAGPASQEWQVKALVFKRAHLNAPLAEEVKLKLLSGEVLKAWKAVYGLRQSATEWWKELRTTI